MPKCNLVQKGMLCKEVKKSECFLSTNWATSNLDVCGDFEASMIPTRIAWLKFKKCGEILHGEISSFKTKRKIYQAVWVQKLS